MLGHTDQDEAYLKGKTRPDLEYVPYRPLNMTAVTPAAEDITQRCLDRIVRWEAGKGRRKRSTADVEKLKDCIAAFLGALFSVPRHAWFRTAIESRIFTGGLSKYSWRTNPSRPAPCRSRSCQAPASRGPDGPHRDAHFCAHSR
jgi:hypothetical protein